MMDGREPGAVPLDEDLSFIVQDCRARGLSMAEWAWDRLAGADEHLEVKVDDMVTPLEISELWGCHRGREDTDVSSGARNSGLEQQSFFFKAIGKRVADPMREVGLRPDAAWHVPEPTLTVGFDDRSQIFGYTIGLDITARDLQVLGADYMVSSKMFHRSAAIGPALVLAGTIDLESLTMAMQVRRRGAEIFTQSVPLEMATSGEQLGRKLSRAMPLLPWTGVMMSTPICPPLQFQLEDGDEIAITVPGIGTLTNTAKIIDASWVDIPEGASRVLRIDPRDTVAVSLGVLAPGQQITVGNVVTEVQEDIPFGHKVALVDMVAGQWVIKYGERIGVASTAIRAGEHVHTHNLESSRGRGDLVTKEGGVD
jgi:2-dehydro-3-deoxy-D-arabinonate dehydratase